MSEWYEAAVAVYLTRGGEVFIAPQYMLDWNKDLKEGGAVPDFVALDFRVTEVVVVEVTAQATWKPLMAKVRQRERRWYRPISRRLLDVNAIGASWRIRSLCFMRDDLMEKGAHLQFAGEPDVTLATLDDCLHQWKYWDKRKAGGLPGEGTGVHLPENLMEQKITCTMG